MAGESLSTLGLFAGIGGIERGLQLAGHRNELLCEIDPGARKVLEHQFSAKVERDIRKMRSFPKVGLIAAGFPCQDLSQAGMTAGIAGKQSRLVEEVFKRLRDKRNGPRWLLLENVPFMLQLQRGKAMRYLVDALEDLGFTWAYRIVDARAFGVPQRRQRVLLLASRTEDPRLVLFGRRRQIAPRPPRALRC
jgi:DNA (cytosine-5)-methyltransferase 1